MITSKVEIKAFLNTNIEHLLSVHKITEFVSVVHIQGKHEFIHKFSKWQEYHDDFSIQEITNNVYALIQKEYQFV